MNAKRQNRTKEQRRAARKAAPGIKIAAALLAIALPAFAGGCGGADTDVTALEDGVYIGVSSEDDDGAYGEVTITVKDGTITDCGFVTWQKDGSVKDEEYGKVNGEISNRDFYDKAQLAVRAMQQYADALVETQSSQDVDAVTGATIAHGQFLEAVDDALNDEK
ncbi:MAG: FMN-binding protein [Clostridiales Family XIII bacterium]|jgi:major membrane immunogen (membrane-anchored lipoprotein)|nr:FMN-binding protein [Clostridiales Family XIII bacterium]